MKDKKFQICVIGAGNWGKNLVSNFEDLGVLNSIAESNIEIKDKLKIEYNNISFYDDYKDIILEQIDAVAIATPAPTHYEIAKYFLSQGIDVFVEKPITLNSEEAKELKLLADKNKRTLMVGHLLLYQPAIQFIKDYITQGELGKIYSIHQERKKLGRARYVENVTWSLGVHDIAVILYLIGEVPLKIFASGHCGLQKEVEDDVYLHMNFSSGTKAHLHNSWLWHENKRQLSVVCEKGIIVYDEVNAVVNLHKKFIDKDLNHKNEGVDILFRSQSEPLKVELSHFIECCEKKITPISNGDNGVLVVQTLEKIQHL